MLMFNPLSVIKYVITDQESEGRQAGIMAAAKCYTPIFRCLEERQSDLKRNLKKEGDDFYSKSSRFIDLCEYYNREIIEYTHKIEYLRKNNVHISSHLSTMGWGAGTAMSLLNSRGGGNGLSIPISLAGAGSLGLAGLASPLAAIFAVGLLGDILEKKMEKKYQKYLKISFEEESRKWNQKLEDIKEEIRSLIEELRKLERGNKSELDTLEHDVQEYMNRYVAVKAIYFAIKDMR